MVMAKSIPTFKALLIGTLSAAKHTRTETRAPFTDGVHQHAGCCASALLQTKLIKIRQDYSFVADAKKFACEMILFPSMIYFIYLTEEESGWLGIQWFIGN